MNGHEEKKAGDPGPKEIVPFSKGLTREQRHVLNREAMNQHRNSILKYVTETLGDPKKEKEKQKKGKKKVAAQLFNKVMGNLASAPKKSRPPSLLRKYELPPLPFQALVLCNYNADDSRAIDLVYDKHHFSVNSFSSHPIS